MAKPKRETTMLAEPEPNNTLAPPVEELPPPTPPDWNYIYSPVACANCQCTEAHKFRPNGHRMDYDGKNIEWGMSRCVKCDRLRITKRTRPSP